MTRIALNELEFIEDDLGSLDAKLKDLLAPLSLGFDPILAEDILSCTNALRMRERQLAAAKASSYSNNRKLSMQCRATAAAIAEDIEPDSDPSAR